MMESGGNDLPASSSSSVGDKDKSLSNFLSSSPSQKVSRGSATVGGGNVSEEIIIRADGKKVRKVKRSSSKESELGGFLSGSSKSKKGSASTVTSSVEDGEVYIRADGKKVRRRVVRKVSASSSDKSLGGFLDKADSKKSSKKSSSNTVAGDRVASREEGEVIVKADGTKVRRIKKSKSGLGSFLDKKEGTSSSSSATVSGATVAKSSASVGGGSSGNLGEVYINKDGKKVRRVKKDKSQKNLGSFLGSGSSAKKGSGSATVAGETPTRSKSYSEGEIYINKDGKKVRRIKRSPSTVTKDESDGSKLESFLSSDSSSKPKAKSSATVTGHDVESEIIIREDGTKVRRIKKTKSKKAKDEKSLSNFLDDGAASAPKVRAKSVSGTPSSKMASSSASVGGEVYINKDGKKVRRVKKKTSSSSSGGLDGFLEGSTTKTKKASGSATVAGETPTKSSEGEIYINAQGKKVRRVKKKKADSSSNKSLSGLLESTTPKKSKSGAATVSGDAVVKSTPDGEIIIRDGKKILRRKKSTAGSSADSEVYRRADGKLVRRVKKRSAAGDLAGFLGDDEKKANKGAKSSSATVAGSDIKPEFSQMLDDQKTQKKAEVDAIAETYRKMLDMGLPEDAVEHKMTQDGVSDDIIEAVLSNNSRDPMAVPASPANKPPTPAISASQSISSPSISALTSEEENTVARFKKMRRLGLPDDAVRQKMEMEGVGQSVVAAVLEESSDQASAPSATTEPAPILGSQTLSGEEEETAARFRKMRRLGLPDDAIKQKMEMEGVGANIIAAVLEPSTTESSSPDLAALPATTRQPLSTDEDEIAARFHKMKKMGLPDDAVRQKMEMEGISTNIMSAVFAESHDEMSATAPSVVNTAPLSPVTLTDEEEATATRFRKMAKMGLPEDAVRQKMEIEGVPAHVANAVFESPQEKSSTRESTKPKSLSTSLTGDEEAIASRFRKMKQVGLPDDAVKQKMEAEGVAAHIIDAVLDPAKENAAPKEGESAELTCKVIDDSEGSSSSILLTEEELAMTAGSSQAPTSGSPAALPEGTLLPRLKDGDRKTVLRYKKMVKMGLPEDYVKQKMVQDGLDEKMTHYLTGKEAPDYPEGVGERAEYYIVEMSADLSPDGPPLQPGEVLETEKFKVLIGNDSKLMSVAQIAVMTGKSIKALQDMILQERDRSNKRPRFVLQEMSKLSASQYEVTVTTEPVRKPVKGEKSQPVKEGEEVVDSKLASAARAVSIFGEDDISKLLEKLQRGDMADLIDRLREAEKRQKKLEKQLTQAGVAIAEDIDYGEALAKIGAIAKRMHEIGGSDVTNPDKEEQTRLREEYFKLEQEMEKYNTALMVSEEYQAEQERLEKEWEERNEQPNLEALKKLRRHMPVKIRHMSEADLCNTPSPNGKFLPRTIAKKFKRTNILQCLRLNPDDIERMHPSTLEGFRVTGLTLTERRALYAHIRPLGPRWEKNKAEKMTERKWTWFTMMKNNFKENLAPYERHVKEYGPPENHPYATRDNPKAGCPLIGKQCPIKADLIIDYNNDYGWTDEAEYEVSEIRKADADDPGARAMQEALELAREKKANERADLLKKHYKGKLLQVSKANGSCEAMDESMDKLEFSMERWIQFIEEKGDKIAESDHSKEVANFTEGLNDLKLSVLDFAQRSGMQTSGKKKAGGDSPDIRSSVECGLAEEVYECAKEFFGFIEKRMKDIKARDTRVEKTIELLRKMLDELHDKNIGTLKNLSVERPERSRKLKTAADIEKDVKEKMKPTEEEEAAQEPAGPAGMPPGAGRGGGRAGLLGAINGRGRGGGRGGLMDAIKGGRGGGRGGRGGGRGGLLDAIKGGRGGGRGGRGDGGGRGGLMAAIQGRGGGDAGGGDGGGRGGLLAAIQGRGPPGGGGGGGGRGGLLAAIQARGG